MMREKFHPVLCQESQFNLRYSVNRYKAFLQNSLSSRMCIETQKLASIPKLKLLSLNLCKLFGSCSSGATAVELAHFFYDQISISNLVLTVFFPAQLFGFKISCLKHMMCCVLKSRMKENKELLTVVRRYLGIPDFRGFTMEQSLCKLNL